MPSSHANRVQMTVSGTPGTGTITLGSAASGYQTFAAAHGANATVDVLITDGTAWEVARDCAYTHSGTTLNRGTLESSSTGSAISLTSAAVVSQIPTAEWGNRLERAMQAVMPGGRLTTESGVPVSTSDRTSQSTLYYTPYVHNTIPLWDGARWVPTTFTETSEALGTLIASRPYDVFGFLSSGALDLELTGWASSTVTITIASPGVVTWTAHGHSNGDSIVLQTTGALPTGLSAGTIYFIVNKTTDTFQLATSSGGSAINTSGSQSGTHTAYSQSVRATAVTLQDGRLCKSGDKTRLWLGSIYTTATTTTADSDTKRYVFNAYNRVFRRLYKTDATSHSYNGGYRQWNNTAGNKVEFLVGDPSGGIVSMGSAGEGASSSTVFCINAQALDSTTTYNFLPAYAAGIANGFGAAAVAEHRPSTGYHYIAATQSTASTGSATFSSFCLIGGLQA